MCFGIRYEWIASIAKDVLEPASSRPQLGSRSIHIHAVARHHYAAHQPASAYNCINKSAYSSSTSSSENANYIGMLLFVYVNRLL
jgi:hypothetical protein